MSQPRKFIDRKKGKNAILSVRGKFTYPARITVLENIGQMNAQEIREGN